jgi:hypothetical protein
LAKSRNASMMRNTQKNRLEEVGILIYRRCFVERFHLQSVKIMLSQKSMVTGRK